jgi:hypothetical protein
LAVGYRAVSRNQFDGGIRRRLPRLLGEKDRAMFRSAQPLPKRKFPADNLPFPCLPVPRIAHALLPAKEHSMPSAKNW